MVENNYLKEIFIVCKYSETGEGKITLTKTKDEPFHSLEKAKSFIIELMKVNKNSRFVILTELAISTDSRANPLTPEMIAKRSKTMRELIEE